MDAPIRQLATRQPIYREDLENFIDGLAWLSKAAGQAEPREVSHFLDKAIDTVLYAQYVAKRKPSWMFPFASLR